MLVDIRSFPKSMAFGILQLPKIIFKNMYANDQFSLRILTNSCKVKCKTSNKEYLTDIIKIEHEI